MGVRSLGRQRRLHDLRAGRRGGCHKNTRTNRQGDRA
uniref:Uncharacterized protein n=1 Tax=Siphoviridae sp. ctgaU3 TaxID=2825609 RepID=A0A8S5UWC2_9CAUD|nr:MAG TPA: hypothetical protein [Siphoviridae sp. ctgaU3]